MPDIHPTGPQFDYITTESQYPAMVAGFGAGKTEAAVKRSIVGKLRYPALSRGFYEPTYDLVRMIAFPRFEEALTELNIPYRLYKSPLNYIEIEGMAGRIFFRSMDTPSRIIGYEHADADVDELDTLKEVDAVDVWRRIQSRNRQNKPDGMANTIGVTTTPEGFRFVHKFWKKEPRDGYQLIQAPTYSNPHLPDGYIQSLKDSYPDNLISAYLEGEFVNLTSGAVYPEFDRVLNDSDETIHTGEPLYIGMDFNVNNMTAIIHVKRDGLPVAVDEIFGARDTPTIITMIEERYQGHKIYVYPDSSGKNNKSNHAGLTDISQLKAAGFTLRYRGQNPRVRDRVNCVNAMICNSKGDRRYKVNSKRCPNTVDNLEQQVFDKNGEPDKKSDNDHAPDGLGYFLCYDYPIKHAMPKIQVHMP